MTSAMPENDALGLVIKAIDFAADKHRSQRRKDAEASPYINHPIALANILWHEAGIRDPITIAAAILHDTVEDTETTRAELEAEFGAEIASVVAEVTDDKSLPKQERKRLQVERAAHKSPRAQRVKIADKISNLRDVANRPPESWTLERRREYFDWAKAVVDAMRGPHADLERIFDEVYSARP